jgi:hypothetical protein
LPRVEAPDDLRSATDEDGFVGRARSNPRLLVTIVAGVILVLAWIAWAIYVTSSDGATAGLGVVIAWPAMLAALALISLPFIGVYLLIRRRADDGGESATTEAEAPEEEPEEDSDDESEPDSEAEASAAS